MTDMNMRANATANLPGRTYRFYSGKTVYPFGHGLSYSSFSKFIISAPSTLLIKHNRNNIYFSDAQAIDVTTINCKDLHFDVVIGVNNSGPMDGSHVVLMFWKPPRASGAGAPNVQLVGFDRADVKRGKTKNVRVRIDVCKRLNLVDTHGKGKLVMGQHTLIVGSPSEHQVRHRLNIKLAKSGSERDLAFM